MEVIQTYDTISLPKTPDIKINRKQQPQQQKQQQQHVATPHHGNIIKMHIIGDEGVGKTAFMKYVTLGHYDPFLASKTTTDFMQREVETDVRGGLSY